MTAGRTLAIIAGCGLLVIAAFSTLAWASDRVEHLGRPTPAEAGDELDPAEAAWLGDAPDRTFVDPVELRQATEALHASLADVLPLEHSSEPAARITRVQVPGGWGESNDVAVLVGAEQWTELPASDDRCAFLQEAVESLARTGWRLTSSRQDAIQTEYPLVSPAPQDITVTGASPLGDLRLRSLAAGGYHLTFGVDRDLLDRPPEEPAIQPAPVLSACA